MKVLSEFEKDKPTKVAFDTETTGLEYYDEAFAGTCAWITAVGTVKAYYFDFSKTTEQGAFADILERCGTPVFHNAKFDIQKLILRGIMEANEQRSFEDTEALAHLLDEHRPKKLKYLARSVLGLETNEEEALKAVRRKLKLKKSDGYHKIPREYLEPYALKDAEYTIRLVHKLLPQLVQYPELVCLYERERALTWALLEIESRGIGVDREYVKTQANEYTTKALKLQLACRDLTQNEEFNPRSNKQIKEYFEGKGILRQRYDKNSLLEIADPMAETLLALRSAEKSLNTYLLAMLEESKTNPGTPNGDGKNHTGILHPHFFQYKPVTGRMSSGKYDG